MHLKKTIMAGLLLSALALGPISCAPVASTPAAPDSAEAAAAVAAPPTAPAVGQDLAAQESPGSLPVRFQRPSYLIQGDGASPPPGLTAEDTPAIPVGADISSAAGAVPLRDIMRRLAGMKKMNISWASDVDQNLMVDVDIQAEDDFFEALDNILRQVDYYHEVQRNTIVIKYRETKRFQIAMPFMTSSYNSGVGGDVLGAGGAAGAGSSSLVGNIQLTSNDNKFDIWENIRQNLDQLLGIWEETVPVSTAGASEEPGQQQTTTRRNVQAGKGYYTIDKPVGQITVTAPRPLLLQIESYISSLRDQLFRQVSIEAKIIEVSLDEDHRSGIDWTGVLRGKNLDFELFGPQGIIYPSSPARWVTKTTIGSNPFQLLLDAIEGQGDANVLANPKISVLNGQPAMITVGETFRYISEVAVTVNEGGTSTSVSTDTVMSGLGLAVLPTITDDDEIVLSLTPVTSQVSEIAERAFSGLTIQLPTINIRELNTIVRVKNGDTLMIGGLIDSRDSTDSTRVPFLGKIPGLGKLFRHDTKTTRKKELVILLQPRII